MDFSLPFIISNEFESENEIERECESHERMNRHHSHEDDKEHKEHKKHKKDDCNVLPMNHERQKKGNETGKEGNECVIIDDQQHHQHHQHQHHQQQQHDSSMNVTSLSTSPSPSKSTSSSSLSNNQEKRQQSRNLSTQSDLSSPKSVHQLPSSNKIRKSTACISNTNTTTTSSTKNYSLSFENHSSASSPSTATATTTPTTIQIPHDTHDTHDTSTTSMTHESDILFHSIPQQEHEQQQQQQQDESNSHHDKKAKLNEDWKDTSTATLINGNKRNITNHGIKNESEYQQTMITQQQQQQQQPYVDEGPSNITMERMESLPSNMPQQEHHHQQQKEEFVKSSTNIPFLPPFDYDENQQQLLPILSNEANNGNTAQLVMTATSGSIGSSSSCSSSSCSSRNGGLTNVPTNTNSKTKPKNTTSATITTSTVKPFIHPKQQVIDRSYSQSESESEYDYEDDLYNDDENEEHFNIMMVNDRYDDDGDDGNDDEYMYRNTMNDNRHQYYMDNETLQQDQTQDQLIGDSQGYLNCDKTDHSQIVNDHRVVTTTTATTRSITPPVVPLSSSSQQESSSPMSSSLISSSSAQTLQQSNNAVNNNNHYTNDLPSPHRPCTIDDHETNLSNNLGEGCKSDLAKKMISTTNHSKEEYVQQQDEQTSTSQLLLIDKSDKDQIVVVVEDEGDNNDKNNNSTIAASINSSSSSTNSSLVKLEKGNEETSSTTNAELASSSMSNDFILPILPTYQEDYEDNLDDDSKCNSDVVDIDIQKNKDVGKTTSTHFVGEDSIPPFAFPFAQSTCDLTTTTGDAHNKSNVFGNKGPYNQQSKQHANNPEPLTHASMISFASNELKIGGSAFTSCSEESDDIFTPMQMATSSKNHERHGLEYEHYDKLDMSSSSSTNLKHTNQSSVNFSKLLRQADDKSTTIIPNESLTHQNGHDITNFSIIPDDTQRKDDHHTTTYSRSHGIGGNVASQSLVQSMIQRQEGKAITLRKMANDSFELSVKLSSRVTVRDVVDVIANPDMLRFWCEPISALVVTDHKGGSGLGTPLPLSIQNNGKTTGKTACERQEYVYPDVEEFDDDMIVPPAADMEEITQRKRIELNKNQQREQHDGEWIKASTPEIILPHSHTTFLDNCYKRVSTFLGFPFYGNVNMYIERNIAQVGFTLGPFKAGTMLSHKMVVSEVNPLEGGGVMLVDEVTIIQEDEEDDGWLLCSCLESVRDITRQWCAASLDGYIDQTKASLRNLVDLVDKGGEFGAFSKSIDAEQRVPLLS